MKPLHLVGPRRNVQDLSAIKFFVLDEADALVKQGEGKLRLLKTKMPQLRPPQVLLYSATLEDNFVRNFAESFTRHANWIDLKQLVLGKNVNQAFYPVNPVKDHRWQVPKQLSVTDGVHKPSMRFNFGAIGRF